MIDDLNNTIDIKIKIFLLPYFKQILLLFVATFIFPSELISCIFEEYSNNFEEIENIYKTLQASVFGYEQFIEKTIERFITLVKNEK